MTSYIPRIMLSVIVPVYNTGSYLLLLINSIINQSWKNLELILVDDGSTDESGQVCDKMSNLDPRIHVVHMQNLGQAAARNMGLRIARGDLIAFADHDDILNPHMYEILIKNMVQTKADVSACSFMHATDDEVTELKFEITHIMPCLILKKDVIKDYFQPSWKIPVWNKVYNRNIIENIRFENYHLGEDNLYSYQTICRLKSIVFIDLPLYVQRMHNTNFEITGLKYYNELLDAKRKILYSMKKLFPKEYPNAYRSFIYECIRIYNLYISANDTDLLPMARKSFALLTRSISFRSINLFPLGHKLLLIGVKARMIKFGDIICV